jgi:hypothetical protein
VTRTEILVVGAHEVEHAVKPYTDNGWRVALVREAESMYAETSSKVLRWLFILENETD